MAYKVKAKKTEREFLAELELKTIQEKQFTIERLDHIRDLFIFSCYTGLAYIDIYNLSPNNISIGIDGEKWIFTHRQKTETLSIAINSLELTVSSAKSNNKNIFEIIEMMRIVSGSPWNVFKESRFKVKRKAPGYFFLKCKTILDCSIFAYNSLIFITVFFFTVF
jgi:hypothetical protein